MKYRKKPIVIEAVQFIGSPLFVEQPPKWLNQALLKGNVYLVDHVLKVITLEGTMTANAGDYIIKDIQDEIYPCKADIFEATYEKVE